MGAGNTGGSDMTKGHRAAALGVGALASTFGIITTVQTLMREHLGLWGVPFVGACLWAMIAVSDLWEKVDGHTPSGTGGTQPM